MSSPLLRFPDRAVVLPPRYMAQAGYYAVMCACGRAVVDGAARYDKRAKAVHRCMIVDTRAPLTLTVPVSVPHGLEGSLRWDMVRVSRHGKWWRLQRTALESAYGRTPYFEFIIDKFDCVLADPGPLAEACGVSELDRRADTVIRRILGIDTCVAWSDCGADIPADAVDMRRASFDTPDMPPYRQIRGERLGFVPSLSILDLIFNLGPEAPLYLLELSRRVMPD